MILILNYEGESASSKAKLRKDAINLRDKLAGRNKSTMLCETEEQLRAYLKTPESKSEEKIHIVAHGNQEQVGPFVDPEGLTGMLALRAVTGRDPDSTTGAGKLAQFLVESGLGTRPNIKRITLHSCHAASAHPKRTDKKEAVFAFMLLNSMVRWLSRSKVNVDYFQVRAPVGETYTSADGRTWVIRSGMALDPVPPRTLEAELQMIARIMQERDVARPIFIADRSAKQVMMKNGKDGRELYFNPKNGMWQEDPVNT